MYLFYVLCFSLFGCYNNRYHASVAFASAEIYHAVSESEESVVAADSYVLSRIMHSAALTNDNVASFAYLPAENFDA